MVVRLYTWQFFVTFLGWLSDLLLELSDLQLGDKKVTLNHLVVSKLTYVTKVRKLEGLMVITYNMLQPNFLMIQTTNATKQGSPKKLVNFMTPGC